MTVTCCKNKTKTCADAWINSRWCIIDEVWKITNQKSQICVHDSLESNNILIKIVRSISFLHEVSIKIYFSITILDSKYVSLSFLSLLLIWNVDFITYYIVYISDIHTYIWYHFKNSLNVKIYFHFFLKCTLVRLYNE